MPAKSVAQQKMMQIAEHHPSELYERNKGAAQMSHKRLHEFASGSEHGKPQRIEHVHEHLQTPHHEPHRGNTVDGSKHHGHVAGTLPAHKHEKVTHHYSKKG